MSSNSDIALSIRNLYKSYTIAHLQHKFTTLGEHVIHKLRNPFERPANEKFWALSDVSLDIYKGEVVGIIGRNGAGKSTLLKILSRITEPTSGAVDIYGRVGSLLEVGTGFHPELTGRENIMLNGAILGMSRLEIRRHFDEIVEFSGTEQFLDTPVKRYSSGMYVRLAFAVAAHLDSEILIIDEVLAVGDADFQKKCLGRIEAVAREGRTVLFVSHNLGVVSNFCTKAMCLERGEVCAIGGTDAVVTQYLNSLFSSAEADIEGCRWPNMGTVARFTDIRLMSSHGSSFLFNDTIRFRLAMTSDTSMKDLNIGVSLFQSSGSCVGTHFTLDKISLLPGEERTVEITLHDTNLAPGNYYAGFMLGRGGVEIDRNDFDIVTGTPHFQILPTSSRGTAVAHWDGRWGQVCFASSEFEDITALGDSRADERSRIAGGVAEMIKLD